MNGYSAIVANDEAVFKNNVFALHLSHIHSNKMWKKTEINWNVMTLFEMQYIHLLDGINNIFMSNHIKKVRLCQ